MQLWQTNQDHLKSTETNDCTLYHPLVMAPLFIWKTMENDHSITITQNATPDNMKVTISCWVTQEKMNRNELMNG